MQSAEGDVLPLLGDREPDRDRDEAEAEGSVPDRSHRGGEREGSEPDTLPRRTATSLPRRGGASVVPCERSGASCRNRSTTRRHARPPSWSRRREAGGRSLGETRLPPVDELPPASSCTASSLATGLPPRRAPVVEWTLADYALASIGAVSVPIYPTSSTVECAYILGNAGARAIVCEDAEQYAKIAPLRAQEVLDLIVTMDGAPGQRRRPR